MKSKPVTKPAAKKDSSSDSDSDSDSDAANTIDITAELKKILPTKPAGKKSSSSEESDSSDDEKPTKKPQATPIQKGKIILHFISTLNTKLIFYFGGSCCKNYEKRFFRIK